MCTYQDESIGSPRAKIDNLKEQLADLLADRRRVNGAIQKIKVEIAIENRERERAEILGEEAA